MEGKALRIVFMGTPGFAVASLDAIAKSRHQVVGVITAVDKEAGRGRKVRYSEVKDYALAHDLILLQPKNLKDEQFHGELKELDADLFVVVAFRMLPKSVWAMPTLGTINLHASLLPQYRGAAPIQRCIMNGETQTGVTTFFIEEQIDTGEVLMQQELEVTPDDTAGTLHDKLMETGASMLVETINHIADGTIKPIPQQELMPGESLKEAHKLFPENCMVDWNSSAEDIRNHIRGLNPFPTAWTTLVQEGAEPLRTKLYASFIPVDGAALPPGSIHVSQGKILVGTGEGAIEILELQVAGKKRMTSKDFLNGFTFEASAKFK